MHERGDFQLGRDARMPTGFRHQPSLLITAAQFGLVPSRVILEQQTEFAGRQFQCPQIPVLFAGVVNARSNRAAIKQRS
jgi:hypothetical protein